MGSFLKPVMAILLVGGFSYTQINGMNRTKMRRAGVYVEPAEILRTE